MLNSRQRKIAMNILVDYANIFAARVEFVILSFHFQLNTKMIQINPSDDNGKMTFVEATFFVYALGSIFLFTACIDFYG